MLGPIRHFLNFRRGLRFACGASGERSSVTPALETSNPLERYFDSIDKGHGIWKWRHYFEVYHRHLSRFVGEPISVMEVGIYSGGSLPMWRSYFGPRSLIYGVDIEPACQQYAADGIRVMIGDQGDRAFWGRVKREVPSLDVLIDDGGHMPEQQTVTLEAMLLHLNPGGVYICEDIHCTGNEFASFVNGLEQSLHHAHFERGTESTASGIQRLVHSVHTYPFMVVIERTQGHFERFRSEKHGTIWQPFLG